MRASDWLMKIGVFSQAACLEKFPMGAAQFKKKNGTNNRVSP